ncbi:MAG: GmrSD restriction endonuclease domain-containing protein [Syntrophales bacterium]
MPELDAIIDARIGEVRTDILDLSFGEIVNLHHAKELIIQPEYQRLFRWSIEQRSRLVESILLELPIPQIFMIENSDGVLELIDGLQRVSSMIQFFNAPVLELDPLRLDGCDLIKDLNGKTFEELPLKLRHRLKRASIRTIVIKRQSKSFLRYEMFKRLNTGGSSLSPQEIRNCSARMLGDDGTNFYVFLQRLASSGAFRICTESLPQEDREQRADEELVLRFLACKNNTDMFKGSVRDWLDNFMEGILLKTIAFDAAAEESTFSEVFSFLSETFGGSAFVKYKTGLPVGGLAPAYYEAVSIGTLNSIAHIRSKSADAVRGAVIQTVQSDDFRAVTGPGANSKEKLRRRVGLVTEAFARL